MSSLTINRPEHVQDPLFEVCPDAAFLSGEAARVHYGNAMEELVCGVLGLTPIPLSGKFDVNFDAMKGDLDFEIKSVREKDGKVPIYDWRRRKEAAANPEMIYVFGLHSAGMAKSTREIWEQYQARGGIAGPCTLPSCSWSCQARASP